MPSVASTPGPSSIGASSSRKRSSTESLGDIRPEKRSRTGIEDRAGEKKKRRRKKKKYSIVDNALASTSVKAAKTMNVDADAQESSDATLASVSSESDAPKVPAIIPADMKGKGKAKEIRESPEEIINRLTEELQAKSLLLKKHDDALRHVQQTMTCQVCLDLLRKPYALSPCGHVACHGCLLQWFTNPPADGEALVRKPKTCPHCRAVITKRPIEIWTIKSAVTGLLKSGLLTDIPDHPQSEASAEEDPWKGAFGTLRLQQSDQDLDMNGMLDLEDGVFRCRDCMHEIWHGVCTNCDRPYPGNPHAQHGMEREEFDSPNFHTHPRNIFGLDVEMSDEDDYDESFLEGSVGSFIDDGSDDEGIEVHDSDSEGDRRSVSWREGRRSPSEVPLSLLASPPRSSVYPSLRNLSPHSSSPSSSRHDTWDATRTDSVDGEDSTFEEDVIDNPRRSVVYRPSTRPIVIDDDDEEDVAVSFHGETDEDEDEDSSIPMTYRGRIGTRVLRAISDEEEDDDIHPTSTYSNFADDGYDVHQHQVFDEDGYADPEDASDEEAHQYNAEMYGYSDSDREDRYDNEGVVWDEDDGSIPGPPSHLRDYLARSEEGDDDLY
ncbi:hypothetical protein IW261DRAFT_1560422 [Armillaria novae-zelandiae]|uniref:RING-type domain-containing protein n=1 Tax=Armillaria novae-zelandiae TaxID=153914 RepID=A0AA39UME1_9AGAR|nr:hypothetical protein IW261DRAFT_1560422 [Armillaria novae-zelandiae]